MMDDQLKELVTFLRGMVLDSNVPYRWRESALTWLLKEAQKNKPLEYAPTVKNRLGQEVMITRADIEDLREVYKKKNASKVALVKRLQDIVSERSDDSININPALEFVRLVIHIEGWGEPTQLERLENEKNRVGYKRFQNKNRKIKSYKSLI